MSSSFRAVFTAIATAVSLCLRQLAAPVITLLIVMVIDYLTGIAKAAFACQLSSRTGLLGILKKVGGLCVVAVGLVTDYVLASAVSSAGVQTGLRFAIGLLVTFWLIVNELISILENVQALGVPLPDFLRKITARLRSSLEQQAESNDET